MPTQRLAAIREGKADLAMLRLLRRRNASAADALAARLMRNVTDLTPDAQVLEATRREVAALLVAGDSTTSSSE